MLLLQFQKNLTLELLFCSKVVVSIVPVKETPYYVLGVLEEFKVCC